MTEKDLGKLPYFELEPGDNIIAYCETCKKPVFVGDGKTVVGNRILKSQVADHLDSFDELHVVDIIRPRRQKDQVTDGLTYITNSQVPSVLPGKLI